MQSVDYLSRQISMHAPARERPLKVQPRVIMLEFQSTLPQGSDGKSMQNCAKSHSQLSKSDHNADIDM